MERNDDSRSPSVADPVTTEKGTMPKKCSIENKEWRSDIKKIFDIINENKDGITKNDLAAFYRKETGRKMTDQKLAIIISCLIKGMKDKQGNVTQQIDWWTMTEKRGGKPVVVKMFGPSGSGKYKNDGKK